MHKTAQRLRLRPRPPVGLGARLVGEEEEALALEAIRSGYLFRYDPRLPVGKQGPMTATLEHELEAKMGVRHALAVTSGTAALEVALAALGVGPGDEVIIPAWSWVSCFTAVVRLGALPVLAEMDENFSLAPGEITRLRTDRAKAVLIMHYQGAAADMTPLITEAREAKIRVLEDCAQSPGALYKGSRVGSIGDIGIYSFQFNKMMSSGEGGAVVTSDSRLYERAIRFHDLGFLRPQHCKFLEPQENHFCGGQYRMNEITAAVALAQLRKLDGIRTHCRRLRDRIMQRIETLPALQFRSIPDIDGDSAFEIYFSVSTPTLAREFTRRLDERNVNANKTTGTYCHYSRDYCLQRSVHYDAPSPFSRFEEWPAPGYRKEDFPRTEDLINRFVVLAIGALYADEDADYIAEAVCEVYDELIG